MILFTRTVIFKIYMYIITRNSNIIYYTYHTNIISYHVSYFNNITSFQLPGNEISSSSVKLSK